MIENFQRHLNGTISVEIVPKVGPEVKLLIDANRFVRVTGLSTDLTFI